MEYLLSIGQCIHLNLQINQCPSHVLTISTILPHTYLHFSRCEPHSHSLDYFSILPCRSLPLDLSIFRIHAYFLEAILLQKLHHFAKSRCPYHEACCLESLLCSCYRFCTVRSRVLNACLQAIIPHRFFPASIFFCL